MNTLDYLKVIRWNRDKDPTVRLFGVTTSLLLNKKQSVKTNIVDLAGKFQELGLTENGAKAIEAILNLNGVYSVDVTSYDIWVHTAPAFHWNHVQPSILEILNDVLFAGDATILAPRASVGVTDAYGWLV